MSNFMVLVFLASIIAIIVFAYKWIRNRHNATLKRKYTKGAIISVIIMVISFIIVGSLGDNQHSTTKSSDTATTKVVKKKKYIGKDKYDIAKKENVALIAKEKKLQDQDDELQDQKDKITNDEASAAKRAKDQQAVAERQQAAEQKKQEAAQSQPSQQASQTKGDMNTSDSGTIVGNVNSHIYHVPGQAGYNMNSSNAVYFNSEQEAINAGYRRAKR